MLGLGLGVDKMAGRSAAVSEETPGTMFSQDDFFWINTDRSPVTLDGSGNVELIENLGTFGGDMQQGTASNRPGYGITQLNGKDVMDLDGVSEYLESTLPAGDWTFLHDGTPYTVLSVFQMDNVEDIVYFLGTDLFSNASGATFIFDDRDGSGREDQARVAIGNGSDFAVVCNSPDNYLSSLQWHRYAAMLDPSNATSGDRCEIIVDGQPPVSSNTQNSTPSVTDPVHTLRMGQSGDSGYMEGQFAETVIVKGRMITANELSKWNTYVQNEWGI